MGPEAWPATPVFPDLAGKVAIVTGGSRGIGAATCRALGANRARVVVGGRDQAVEATRAPAARRSASPATSPARPISTACAAKPSARSARPTSCSRSPAASAGARRCSIWAWTRAVVEANLDSTFLTLAAFAPGMVERGAGAIVTMASNSARYLDVALNASYAAAGAGVIQLSRHAAKELGPHGVRVNCIAPATTLTERVAGVWDEANRRRVAELSPLGRLGTLEDSAHAALFLASDAAGWITGVTLDVAGGRITL